MIAALYAQIRDDLEIPDLGEELLRHIGKKKHPQVRNASISAWKLIHILLRGQSPMPKVHFEEGGKPALDHPNLHISIAHSGEICAAILSDAPCAIDIEMIRPAVSEKLREKCLSEAELAAPDADFFTFWTRKECIGKLSGEGIIRRPNKIDTLDPQYAHLHFFTDIIHDAAGQAYRITAVNSNGDPIAPKLYPFS